MAQKIVYWLLITLVISLGFGQLLRFDLFGISLFIHDILVILILLMQAPTIVMSPKKDHQGLFDQTHSAFSFKLMSLALLISSVYALTQYHVSLLLVPSFYMFRLLAYVGLYLMLQKSKIHIPKNIFMISAMIALLIGLIQYTFLPDMRIFQFLGWDDHLSRLTLPHFDPTFSAVMMSLQALSLWGIAPFLFIGILLTYARSVWVSLIITALSFVRPAKYLLIVPVFIVCIMLLPKRFGEGTNLLRTFSITSRLESDVSYIAKYNWDLVIGRGLNTLILDAPESIVASHATGPNNSYLYLLATTGILGLVGWGMFMQTLYSRSTHKPMLAFFFVASLFNNVMFYSFALIWVLLIESDIVA